jgi:hypothetical protein
MEVKGEKGKEAVLDQGGRISGRGSTVERSWEQKEKSSFGVREEV